MRKTGIILLAILLGIAGNSFAAKKTSYRAFTPSGAGKSVFVKTGAKQLKYFVVEKGASFGFEVTGPTKVKVRTRAEFNPGVKNLDYEIQVWEADKMVAGRKVKATPALISVDNQNVGLARTVIIKVPKGRHSYRLWLSSDKADKYYARFYQAKKSPRKTQFSTFKPAQFEQQVTLLSGKKSLSYYLIDGNGGVSISVIGPTKLKIYCRANYNQTMKGRSKFTLGMYESGKEAAQFPGAVTIASNLQFKELNDLVPSTLNTYTFDVPGGKHVYEFKKIESASPNLAVRFKITKVGLGMVP